MNKKKWLSLLMAVVLCMSMALGAMATPAEDSSLPEQGNQEESSREPVSEIDTGFSKTDIVTAIMRALGSVDLAEIKDSLNDINEALGLPRVEDFTDMAAYADALYEKFEELGISYDGIINSVTSSEFIQWVNDILFKPDNKPTTATPVKDDKNDNQEQNGSVTSPDTGISYSAVSVAAVTLMLSLGVAVLLKKRGIYAE